jgi:hypothetical protein
MENKNCEICESLATNLCFKCLAYYCDSCYNLIHKKKENGDQHKKDNLNSNIIHIEIKYFRNLHKDHKVIEINDEEILKQNNISIENEENDLNILIEESYKIKEQIMEEMKLIDKTFEDLNKEITNCFIKKQENLIKKENEIKDTLKNEITKIKE